MDFAKIDSEIKNENYWRAREILLGQLGSHGFSPERYLRLGDVSQKLGDTLGAARYYFYSGNREGQPGKLAKKYLDSTLKKRGIYALLKDVPKTFKKADILSQPDNVLEEIVAKGFSQELIEKRLRYQPLDEHPLEIDTRSEKQRWLERTKVFLIITACCVGAGIALGLIYSVAVVVVNLFDRFALPNLFGN